jgi:hypothetical protein
MSHCWLLRCGGSGLSAGTHLAVRSSMPLPSKAALVAAMLALVACGSEVATSGETGGGGGGPGGGGSGGDGSGGTEDPDQADHEALEGCAELACPDAFAQRIEGGSPATMNAVACVVAAMRDRTPGLYRIDLDHTWTNGSATAKHTVLVTASGEVEVGRIVEAVNDFQPAPTDYEPTERCALQPASFFDDCLAAVEANSESAWDCVYPEEAAEPPWFTGCAAQPPLCQ